MAMKAKRPKPPKEPKQNAVTRFMNERINFGGFVVPRSVALQDMVEE